MAEGENGKWVDPELPLRRRCTAAEARTEG